MFADSVPYQGSYVDVVRSFPTRHPRLGYSVARKRQTPALVHLVHNVNIVWIGGKPYRIECRFRCSSSMWNGPVVLVDQIPEGENVAQCERCDIDGIQVAPQVLYLVDTGSHLKVGCTTNVVNRARTLGGQILHQVPGGYDAEKALLRALPLDDVARGREWLHHNTDVRARAIAAMNLVAEAVAA